MIISTKPYYVLITGATGFIGSALARYLFSRGMKIRALTRDMNHREVIQHPEYEWIATDLTKPILDNYLCSNIDFVFHAAGFAHASKNNDDNFREKHQQINEQATIRLAQLAQQLSVKRFIFFSSVKAVQDSDQCTDETWTMYPTDPYGLAKRNAEEKLLKLTSRNSMEVIILRLSLVYGVHWKGNLAAMLTAIDKNIFPRVPRIDNKKSMISLLDVCEAARLAAFFPVQSQRVFILTDDSTYSTYEIYQAMRRALNKKKTYWSIPLPMWKIFGKPGDLLQKLTKKNLPINSESIEKLFGNAVYISCYAKSELGFSPQFRFTDLLPEIVSSYRNHL